MQRISLGHRRALTASEAELISPVFGAKLDAAKIHIREQSPLGWGAKRTIGNTVHIAGRGIAPAEVVHEAAHCYQHQRGDHYIVSSLTAQFLSWLRSRSRRGAYDYSTAVAEHRPFGRWNAEQQATWIEHNRRLPPSRTAEPGYP